LLFDDFERTNGAPREFGEGLFPFLNRAAGPYWQSVRDLLSGWVSNYPADHRSTLVARFQRTDERGFLGAFWELYLHELFRRLGFAIELHPVIDGVRHRPDFLLSKSGRRVYLEAVTNYESQSHSADDERLAPLFDAVHRIESRHYVIQPDARQIANVPLPVDAIVDELRSWLATLDGEPLSTQSRAEPAPYKWQMSGWSLFFRAIPGSDHAAEKTRAVNVGAKRSRASDEARAVRQQLAGKARFYGRNLGSPYLIALASYRPGHSSEALLAGLFGSASERRDLLATSAHLTTTSNRGESLWLTSRGVRYQNASAVLTAFELMPWSVAHSQPWLIENPWATHPLEIELPFDRFTIDLSTGEATALVTGLLPYELFGLAADWPPGREFAWPVTDASRSGP